MKRLFILMLAILMLCSCSATEIPTVSDSESRSPSPSETPTESISETPTIPTLLDNIQNTLDLSVQAAFRTNINSYDSENADAKYIWMLIYLMFNNDIITTGSGISLADDSSDYILEEDIPETAHLNFFAEGDFPEYNKKVISEKLISTSEDEETKALIYIVHRNDYDEQVGFRVEDTKLLSNNDLEYSGKVYKHIPGELDTHDLSDAVIILRPDPDKLMEYSIVSCTIEEK